MGIIIDADGDITTTRTITSSSTITGAPVVSTGGLSGTSVSTGSGPISGGAISGTTGTFSGALSSSSGISTTGTITAGGNVSGSTYFGNAGQAIGFSGTISGGGETYQMLVQGNPGYNTMWYRFQHAHGSWAGHQWYIAGVNLTFEMRENGIGYSNGGWTTFSDRRVKTNLVKIENALAKVRTLTGYTFDRIDLKNYDGTPQHAAGLIAQDVQAVLPDAVLQDPPTETNPDPTRSLNYDGVIALLVNAINEIQDQIDDLKVEINSLKNAS